MDERASIQAVTPLAEAILGTKAKDLMIQIVETKLRWIKQGRIVWARARDLRSAMFWVVNGRAPVYLGGPDALDRVSELIVASTGPLPHGLSPLALSEAIRQLTFDPRGQIGSNAFLTAVEPHLGDWLHEDDAPSRARFASLSTDPTIDDLGRGRFLLTFNAFNVKGGVERWEVEGDASKLIGATRTTAAPDDTFRWPAA